MRGLFGKCGAVLAGVLFITVAGGAPAAGEYPAQPITLLQNSNAATFEERRKWIVENY